MNATDCGFFQNITNATICGVNEPENEQTNSIAVSAMFTISTWIILLNGAVVICFAVSKDMKKNVKNAQVLSLSFTDLLVGFSFFMLILNNKLPRSFKSYEVCLSVLGFYGSAQIASFNHTFCICLHRFVTVFFRLKSPRRHERATIGNTMIQVLIAWLVALTFALVPPIVFGRWDSTLKVCTLDLLFEDRYSLVLSIYAISLLAPQIVINIMYTSIYLKLRHTWVKVEAIPNTNQLSTTPTTRTKESVTKQLKLLHGPKFIESKTDNMLKVPQHRSMNSTNSTENSLQLLSPKTAKQEDSALPNNRSGIKDNTILDSQANLQSSSRQTMCHDVDSVDKSSNKVHFNRGKNLTRHSDRQSPLDLRGSTTRRNRTQDSKHSKILVTVGLVLIFLNICLTPLIICFILESLQEDSLSRKTKFLILTFSVFNSGINPIIYAFRIEELRQSIKRVCNAFKHYFVN